MLEEIQFSDKYAPLFEDNTCRYYIITGGRGSAKSFATTTATTLRTFEQGHRILFTRFTMTSAHLSIIPEFLEKIELLNVTQNFQINKTDIKNIATGSDVIFRGIRTSSGNQTAALKSLQGITTWILDEAEELVEEDIFDKIALSVRQKGVHNRIILILNPATKEHWIYKRFFENKGIPDNFNGIKDNVCYIHTSYLDNEENLDEDYIHSLEIMRERRPEKYKHQILGSWLDRAEGVIFNNWEIGKVDESLIPVYGQDYGFSTDISTLVQVSINKRAKKIYVKECFGRTGLTTSEIYQLNNRYAGKHLIIGDSAEPRLIKEVKDRGSNIQAVKKGKDSIIAGISMMLDYDIIVDENSTGIIRELNNYVWHDKKSQTPVDNHNHYIDAIRYSVFYQLGNPNKGKYMMV